jgi:hypothetical protein
MPKANNPGEYDKISTGKIAHYQVGGTRRITRVKMMAIYKPDKHCVARR